MSGLYNSSPRIAVKSTCKRGLEIRFIRATVLTRNRAGNFSIGRLTEALAALGQDVRITVKPTKKAVREMEAVVG